MFKFNQVHVPGFLYSVLLSNVGLTALTPCVYVQVKKTFPARPNIFFIIVKELHSEVECYGYEQIICSNLDRLAERGQLFLRTYRDYPSPGTAGASLLSGVYSSQSRWNRWDATQAGPGFVSLPIYLKNNGYRAVVLDKVNNGFSNGEGSGDKGWQPFLPSIPRGYQIKKGIGNGILVNGIATNYITSIPIRHI